MQRTRTIWLAIVGAAALAVAVPGLAGAAGTSPAPRHGYPAPSAPAHSKVHLAHPARAFRTHPLDNVPAFSTIQSNNWSGFAAYGDHFRYVSTTYSVPSLNCGISPGGSAVGQWAGLDGYGSNTVEQVGTFAECSAATPRTPSYFGFYEMFPSTTETGSFTGVSAGDSVTATVYYSSSQWHLTLSDNTTGTLIISVSGSCPSGSTCHNASAEVISEVPNGGPPSATLPDYGTAGFTQIAITDAAGNRDNFFSSHWKNDKIYEYDSANGHEMQAPSKLEGSQSGSGGGWGNQAFTDTALNPS